MKFYIRGKPWLVSVDDTLPVDTSQSPSKLVFSQPETGSGAIWAPIIEKAWAKVVGNYELMKKGNSMPDTIRLLTVAPVATFFIGMPGFNRIIASGHWDVMQESFDLGYILSATTFGEDYARQPSVNLNDCGLPYYHSFSILSLFEMTDPDLNVY